MPNTSRICPLGCDEESRPRQLCSILVGTVLALARSCGEGSTICSSRLLCLAAIPFRFGLLATEARTFDAEACRNWHAELNPEPKLRFSPDCEFSPIAY
jgi:hypothetical protein